MEWICTTKFGMTQYKIRDIDLCGRNTQWGRKNDMPQRVRHTFGTNSASDPQWRRYWFRKGRNIPSIFGIKRAITYAELLSWSKTIIFYDCHIIFKCDADQLLSALDCRKLGCWTIDLGRCQKNVDTMFTYHFFEMLQTGAIGITLICMNICVHQFR